MIRSRIGRADLMTAIAQSRGDAARAAALIGYEPVPDDESPPEKAGKREGDEPTRDEPVPQPGPISQPPPARVIETRLRTWRVVGYERLEPPETAPRKILVRLTLPAPTKPPPRIAPLAPARSLLVRLRSIWEQQQARGIDLEAVVARISQGEVLIELPRKAQRKWGHRLDIIADRSERLVPYWADQDYAVRVLLPLFPRGGVGLHVVSEIDQRAVRSPGLAGHGPDSHLLVLGDLGALERGRRGVPNQWLELGRKVRRSGGRPLALVPCAATNLPPDLRDVWEVIPWEPGQTTEPLEETGLRAGPLHLFQVLLSKEVRLEPGLVREVRRILPDGGHDAALESFFWQQEDLIGTSEIAATWHPDAANRLRREFDRSFHPEADHLRERALQLLETWHEHLPSEIFFEEVLGLDDSTIARLGWEAIHRQAVDHFRWLRQHPAEVAPGSTAADWFRRLERRLSDSAWRSSPVAEDLAHLWGQVHHDDPEAKPPSGLKTVQLDGTATLPEQQAVICEFGDGLSFQQLADGVRPQRVIATLATRSLLLQTENAVPEVPFWKGPAPPFARRFGRDQFGPWFEFEVERSNAEPVRQQMRWIPAGSFRMGSPDSDDQAFDDEKPQHPVTIRRGFWMFDTPCPQELWSAVMGTNPSRFPGERRPVEKVSWNDAQEFVRKLRALIGLELSLPSEAQWEYACRAGTTTRYHFGDAITPRDARYGESPERETAGVGSYPPNARGLFDMHGNVWEWCLDGKRTYSAEPVADPLGSIKEGASRVIRGGSWSSHARYVRAACRFALHPGLRDFDLGFRCVWVQSSSGASDFPSGASSSAEPVEPVTSDRAGEGAEPDQPGGAAMKISSFAARDFVPNGNRAIVRSDSARLTLESFEQPDWASAFGRDRYGLWADLRLQYVTQVTAQASAGFWIFKRTVTSTTESHAEVTQRLRWIPPGQMLMGSPDSEPGRFDDEGPQHRVTLSRGFWIFDTPCTQQLWQAVMGENPSRFKDPLRPVESIDWTQACDFARRLSAQIPQLAFDLPTEAQWEYACRAGTESAVYAGDLTILGDAHAPALDPIAWYGGNSGVNYDLDDGDPLTYLSDKQYAFDKAGTRPVKQKQPNPWGLYDMLGNVWEWCRNGKRTYSTEPQVDPDEPSEAGAVRVIRGGCWDYHARGVRAACRNASHPGDRGNDLGFRCVWVQSSSGASPFTSGASGSREVEGRDRPRRDE